MHWFFTTKSLNGTAISDDPIATCLFRPSRGNAKSRCLMSTTSPSVIATGGDDETLFALMRIRGMECRSRYAEAFQTSKAVLARVGAGTILGLPPPSSAAIPRPLTYLTVGDVTIAGLPTCFLSRILSPGGPPSTVGAPRRSQMVSDGTRSTCRHLRRNQLQPNPDRPGRPAPNANPSGFPHRPPSSAWAHRVPTTSSTPLRRPSIASCLGSHGRDSSPVADREARC